ncbi:hypothetical protein ACLKA6_006427 [Drosophila palustris]
MWRIYNMVQLQPLLCRNQGTNSSSRSQPPSIIDHSKKENVLAMKGNSNEYPTEKLSSLRKPLIDMNNRMSGKHSSWYGGSKKLMNRFRDVVRNRFYDCEKSNAGSRLFTVAEEMKDKTGTENTLIRQWMQKLVHGSNVALPLPHFKSGYLVGNSQSSMKLLDLKKDQLYGYDETDC